LEYKITGTLDVPDDRFFTPAPIQA
jgi:hypothetical protein